MIVCLIWVQRYGDFRYREIPHVGYSAYHKYGILLLFPLTPYLYIGRKTKKKVNFRRAAANSSRFILHFSLLFRTFVNRKSKS